MRELLAANLVRLRKTGLFWGAALLHAAFALFRIYTIVDDRKYGYETTLDEALFTFIMIEGLVMAVFIAVFLGTEYSDGTVRNKITAGHGRVRIYLANLLTVCLACLVFTAVYLLTTLAVGLPVLGGLTLGAGVIASKSTGCILCILLFFGLMIASTYVAAMLDAPPERAAMELVDGELVTHMEPNPKYLTEGKRAVYQFVLDFLPTGQATQYMLITDKTAWMSLYSGLIVLLTAGGGLAYFRRKDIR